MALGAVALASAFLPITSGCQGHQCDYSESDFGGGDSGQGRLIPTDPNTWETTPIEAEWLPYPHAHRTKLYADQLIGREIIDIRVYISPDPKPASTFLPGNGMFRDPNTNFTTAAGNLAVIKTFGTQIWVENGTCADFYMRAVITAAPAVPVVDAGSADAPSDAPTDADEGGN